jgi:hypothetical protein
VLIQRGTEHALGNASPASVSWITLISPGADAGCVQAEHELIIGPAPPLPEGPPGSR